MQSAPALQRLLEELERLPGVGPKTAQRYAYSVINKAETTYANNQNLVNAMRAMYAYHNSAKDLLN